MENAYLVRVSGERYDGPFYAQEEFSSLEEAREYQWKAEQECFNWLYFSVVYFNGEEI